jgi:hypothetical protein
VTSNFSLGAAMDPNPTALRSVVKHEDVEKHRSLSCLEYDACLDAASRRSWRSWSCGSCQMFRFAREARTAECLHHAAARL